MRNRICVTIGLIAVLLAGCAPAPARSPVEQGDAPVIEGLTWESSLPLEYAQGFAVYRYQGGYSVVELREGGSFLVVPQGGQVPSVPEGYAVLQQPLENIYLVATSSMSLFRALGALDHIRFSGTKQEGWTIPEAARAMEAGDIVYAGKYSSPDYELLTREGCGLAVESTMIYHSPEVKEKLEDLGVPVLVERSSYEPHPLGRTEWVKLYGVLLGKEDEAEAAFRGQAKILEDLSGLENTGKTVAFFYVTQSGTVSVRKSSDYLAAMIELAGGRYIFNGLGEDGQATSSVNMTMEEFYHRAREADFLVYNATIDAPLETLEELLEKSGLFADFKAVQEGNVWSTGKDLYQATDELGAMIGDLHAMLTGEGAPLTFLHRLS